MSYGIQTFKADGSLQFDSSIYGGIRFNQYILIGNGAVWQKTISVLLDADVECYISAQPLWGVSGGRVWSYSFTYSHQDANYKYYVLNVNFQNGVYGKAIIVTK